MPKIKNLVVLSDIKTITSKRITYFVLKTSQIARFLIKNVPRGTFLNIFARNCKGGAMKESKGNIEIGIWSGLFITFLILKLCGVITWSWWWIFSPFWLPFLTVSVFFFLTVSWVLRDRK